MCWFVDIAAPRVQLRVVYLHACRMISFHHRRRKFCTACDVSPRHWRSSVGGADKVIQVISLHRRRAGARGAATDGGVRLDQGGGAALPGVAIGPARHGALVGRHRGDAHAPRPPAAAGRVPHPLQVGACDLSHVVAIRGAAIAVITSEQNVEDDCVRCHRTLSLCAMPVHNAAVRQSKLHPAAVALALQRLVTGGTCRSWQQSS